MLQRLAVIKLSGVGSHINFENKCNVLQNNKILSEAKKVISCALNSSVIYELAKISILNISATFCRTRRSCRKLRKLYLVH